MNIDKKFANRKHHLSLMLATLVLVTLSGQGIAQDKPPVENPVTANQNSVDTKDNSPVPVTVPEKSEPVQKTQTEQASIVPAVTSTKQEESVEPVPTPQAAQSINELWSRMDISESQWSQLEDGIVWAEDQTPFAVRLLAYFKRFPLDLILPWTQSSEAVAQLLDGKNVDADKASASFETRAFNRMEFRGTLYHLVGTAEIVDEVPLSIELQNRFAMPKLYFVAVKLSTGQRVVIITSIIPKRWQTGASVSYPISADACFIKHGPLDKQKDLPKHSYFIATRVAWHPDTTLGNLGMDYGLFDDLDSKTVPPERKIPFPSDCTLNERNRECFFQMLAASKKALDPQNFSRIRKQAIQERDAIWNMRDPRRAMENERHSYPVEELFNDPIAQRGKLFWLSGRAKRIIAIPVNSPDIKKRFGIDKYYNIYLFTHDSADNPLVIVALELPEGVETGDGINYSVDLSIPCFMFNTWMYERTPNAQGKKYQLAPLLIAPKALKFENAKIQGNNFISNSILLMTALIIVFFFFKTLFSKPAPRAPKEENFEFKSHDPDAVEPEFNYEFPEKKKK